MLLRKMHADAVHSAAKTFFDELEKIPASQRMAAIAQFGVDLYMLLARANSEIAFDELMADMFASRTALP